MNAPVVRMRGITKRFPGVLANDGIDLTVAAGEIHAVIGENGAGKTTLMNALAGLHRPDEGEILVDGRPETIRGARRAAALGIGMVHQHFMLIPRFTVAENVMLGRETRWSTPSGRAAMQAEVSRLARTAGFDLAPERLVEDLSVAEEQRVEIVRVVSRGARVLILDEPTALLAPPERQALFEVVRRLRAQGRAILLVTHRLAEVMTLADRVTVLRRGRRVATCSVADTDEAELARLMVGREVGPSAPRATHPAPGEPVLRAESISVAGDRGEPAVRDVDLVIRAGEIVGLAAIEGNGQRELLGALVGLRPVASGRLTVAGRDASRGFDPRAATRAGVGHVPADRLGDGLVPDMTCEENLLLGRQREPALAARGLLRGRAIRALARRVLEEYGVTPVDPRMPAGALSGGNQQKLVLARELSRPGLGLLVAEHPTRGVDIGAVEAIHGRLRAARDSGLGLLIHSHDLDEILAFADRVLVLYRGRIVGEGIPGEIDEERFGLLLTGGAS